MGRILTLLALLALLVVIALPGRAHGAGAYEIASTKADFHVTLTPHQARMCVAWPTGHTDPVGCEGLDVARFATIGATAKDITVEGVVLLREEEAMFLVMVMRDSARFGKLDERSLDEFAQGSMKGMKDRLPEVPIALAKKRIVQKNGLEVGDVSVTASFPEDAPAGAIFTHSRYFQVRADGATFTVVLSTGPKGLAKLDTLSEETMSTLSARKPKPKGLFDKEDDSDSDDRPSDKHGSSKAFRLGETIGRFLGFALVIGVVVLVIVAATRRRKPPQQGYPPQQPQQVWPHPAQPSSPPPAGTDAFGVATHGPSSPPAPGQVAPAPGQAGPSPGQAAPPDPSGQPPTPPPFDPSQGSRG